MNKTDIKKILEEQVRLLSKYSGSKAVDIHELADAAHAMLAIFRYLAEVEDIA